MQICLNFFEVISYITGYYSKDDSGTIEFLRKAKKEIGEQNTPQQRRQFANVFQTHRRMSEAEALYRVMPHMHLSESNVKCVFVATGFPETRFTHANRLSTDPEDPKFLEDPSVYEIEVRQGFY